LNIFPILIVKKQDVINMPFRLFWIITFCQCLSFAYSQDKPKKPFQLYDEAETVFNERKYREAVALLNECLKINPGYMDAYPLRASAREQLNDLDGALTDYSIFLEKYPEHPDVLLSRAMLRYKLGFYELARDDFSRLLTLSSPETNTIFFRQNMSVNDHSPMMTTTNGAHNSFVYNYLGLNELKLKNFTQAIAYLDSAIKIAPREPEYFVNRGLAKEGAHDSTAIDDYARALRLSPNHVLAQHNFAALQAKKKQSISAEERLTQTIDADSTMLTPYLERAQQRFESGYFKGAEEDYTMAIELDSSNLEVWLARGLARERQKNYKGAFSDYTKAIDIKENYAKAWINRGNVLLKLDRYDDAIEDYTVALLHQGDNTMAYYNRAMAKFKLKRNAEACADLAQAENLGMKVEEKVKSKICQKQP
jgi:tetratricopeptide (TPR) repeat protein